MESGRFEDGLVGSNGDALVSVEAMRSLVEETGEIEDIVDYKQKTKTLFGVLLRKMEEDAEYQRSLEEQIDMLADDCKHKDVEIERLSADAQDAINDCRRQAEAMAENMFSKISCEVNGRVTMETLVCRMQKDLSAAQVNTIS